jgi:acetyl-CoA carboxylase carboxyl transferase subunit alpha
MLENSYYSVISPEGCAAILWKESTRASEAAEALKLTASELYELHLIDDIVKEPVGGAHRDPAKIARTLKDHLGKHLDELCVLSRHDLVQQRYEKYRRIGVFSESAS